MKPLPIFLILVLTGLATACRVEPEPIVYGTDNCHVCKMTMMDKRFGAEVVTRKGKVYKFDDVNCMMDFLHSGFLQEQEIKYRLVADYAQPDKLVPADEAFYIKSAEIRSPMASQVAAFGSEEAYKNFKKEANGIYLTWGELTTQFK
ncbi:MAG: nitrous oxide reductase accessory protein NosL [Cyclobacteriaceae bacterium]|jgi:copper chaperone NosL|nr:nitrous oxide reductase accessory protein NosL [Cyclobacteriaceae bacterium]